MSTAQPNFLFLITDQHRADHLGAYGNKVVQTPNIDRVAARGLTFNNFYVSCPICMPNRATLMTGRLPSVNGVLSNGLSLPWDSNTFVHMLRNVGYRTALLGKSHLQNVAPLRVDDWNYPPVRDGSIPPLDDYSDAYLSVRQGEIYENERRDLWEQNPDREIVSPYYGFEKVHLASGHGDRVGGAYKKWMLSQDKNANAYVGPENALPDDRFSAPLAWRTQVPEELYSTTFVEQETINYLKNYAEEGGSNPFFIQCSFPDPHHPFTPPGRYWGMYDPADCEASASINSTPNDPPPFRKMLWDEFRQNNREHRVAAYAVTEQEARESVALTYGMISFVDDAIGRILGTLNDLGMADNTVIVFTSDHGDLMGDHGLMLKHCFHNDGLIRAPFIWSDPDARDSSARTDLLSGTIDIAASVMGRAGVQPYHGIQGFDSVSAARAGNDLPRLGLLIEEDELPVNANCRTYLRIRSFVTERWRLTYWMEHAFGELYDRLNDPLELNNLWNDPAAAADKSLMLEMMMRERIAHDEMAPRAVLSA